jgi:hypothetical protein
MPMIVTGDVFTTPSGRTTTPAPKIDCTSERKTLNTIKRLHQWMIDEARKEAEATKNDFLGVQLSGMSVKNLSQSDIDTLNYILFDHLQE